MAFIHVIGMYVRLAFAYTRASQFSLPLYPPCRIISIMENEKNNNIEKERIRK